MTKKGFLFSFIITVALSFVSCSAKRDYSVVRTPYILKESNNVCFFSDELFYSTSKGVMSMNSDSSFGKDIERPLLACNDDTMYAYDRLTGNVYVYKDNDLVLLSSIIKNATEIYVTDDDLLAFEYDDSFSPINVKVYDLTDFSETDLDSVSHNALSFADKEKDHEPVEFYYLNENKVLILVTVKGDCYFAELYDILDDRPEYVVANIEFCVWKIGDNEMIAEDPYDNQTGEVIWKYTIENNKLKVDEKICEDYSVKDSRYFGQIKGKNAVFFCSSKDRHNRRFSDSVADLNENRIVMYDEQFNISSSVHSDKRIIAVTGDAYYVYDSGKIIGYMIQGNKEVSKKVIEGYEKNGSYTFDYCEGHIFVFDDHTGEVINICSIA